MKPTTLPRTIYIIVTLLLGGCSSTTDHIYEESSSLAVTKAQNPKQWHCEGGAQNRWHCIDLASAEIQKPYQTAPSEKMQALVPTPSIENENQTHPLQIFPSGSFVVQLIAAHEQKTIDDFQDNYPQLQTRQVTIDKNGRVWQILILGPYDSINGAKASIKGATKLLTERPWIRSTESIQRYLVY